MDFVALDFETTGYEDGGKNEPWQLGLAVVRGGAIVETREFFFDVGGAAGARPYVCANPVGAGSGRPMGTLLSTFPDWAPLLMGQRLVAHNIACEKTILTRTAPLTKWGPWVDTMKLARARYPRLPSYALGDVCEALGCVPQMEGRTWHDGLYDAVACAELALRLALPY